MFYHLPLTMVEEQLQL